MFMRNIFNSQFKYYYLLGLFVFITTAIFSVGFHHPDEYFQILEFASYKLGNTPSNSLAWEFADRIRPTLQPTIAFLALKLFNTIGLINPFTISLILRLITALLAWLVISKISHLLLNQFKTTIAQTVFVFSCFFLWYVPYTFVRFSSENYSALFFLLGIYILLKQTNSNQNILLPWFLIGVMFGCSFYFRFQMAFAILGVGIWLVFFYKISLKKITALTIAFLIICIANTCIDTWFYNEFVITPWRYFASNIIDNKASNWGVTPCWFYITGFLQQAAPPLSLALLLFIIVGILQNKTHFFSIAFLVFIIGHSIIGHKEMRFMYPIIIIANYLAALGVDYITQKSIKPKLLKLLFKTILLVNLFMLLYRCFVPAQEQVLYYNYIYDIAQKNKINLIGDRNNFNNILGSPVYFLKSNNVRNYVANSDEDVLNIINTNKFDSVYVMSTYLNSPLKLKYKGYKTTTEYSFYPNWIKHFNINNWQSRTDMFEIYKIKIQL